MPARVLICHDGSPDADAALEHAARLMPGAEATVLTFWEPLDVLMTRAAGALWRYTFDADAFDVSSEAAARQNAEAAAERARELGLGAVARVVSRNGPYHELVLAEADAAGADAVVLGTRGRSGVASSLLGGVSQDVLHHADRPVVVVPSASLARERTRRRG